MTIRPKRRDIKDNPYTLEYLEDNKYAVSFKNSCGKTVIVEITETIYKAFNSFELEDIRQRHQYERHIEHSELQEETMYKRSMDKPIMVDEQVIKNATFEDLKEAINMLPEVQKRRIKKYYFEDKTQKEIAEDEEVDIRSIQYTLNIALNNLRKILKK